MQRNAFMTDDPKPRQDDPVTQEDGRLVKELESLYQRVASVDSPEVASDIVEDPTLYYKILQIHPNVSLSDIHLAYGKMTSAWDPERYPHVPSWKETSTEKLKEIKNAYEKLLLLHAARETADPGDSIHPPLSTALLSVPVNPDPEETASVRANVNVFSGSPFKRRLWLLAPGALIAIILLLVFLWPTLYHYGAIRLGGKDYPLRINRLTTHTQYFDGRQWLEPPFRVETPHNVPPRIASPPLPAQPTGAGIRNEPKPASFPPIKNISPQIALSPLPAQPTGTGIRNEPKPSSPPPIKNISPQIALSPLPAQPTGAGIQGEPKPTSPPPAKQEITPPDRIGVTTKTRGPYSIQVSAYPARNKAEALAKEIQAKNFTVRVEAVSIPGKGQWYRVLLGQFENRAAALQYLKDHQIGEIYPGSFIQKSVGH
jgi:cell division septation protein DedD